MCTRVMYCPEESRAFVGRNMDFAILTQPDLWVLPEGMERDAGIKFETFPLKTWTTQYCNVFPSPLKTWTSKYSSVITSAFATNGVVWNDEGDEGGAAADGLNSEGLTANLLWLVASNYPKQTSIPEGCYPMSISVWLQYILDTCATVKEAILAMDDVYIISIQIAQFSSFKEDTEAKCHLSVGDRYGNTAIFEYIEGELVISTNVEVESRHTIQKYSKKEVEIMTNDPKFDEQVTARTYWEVINKDVYKVRDNLTPPILPGSGAPVDRLVRASYYTEQLYLEHANKVEKNSDYKQSNSFALGRLCAVLDNAAQPMINIFNPETPNTSTTQYVCFSDTEEGQYFYRSRLSPYMIWINFKDVDFDALVDGKAYKLALDTTTGAAHDPATEGYLYGDVTDKLQQEDMFEFVPVVL